ncbi:thiamine pyrophosphate-binding protein [candidate division WWE3 bacterium]|uniref:Thiamine pyrophosphate-binding protein n=1 Tax=candidate division WWE3 bacterium TaxID=2053526 RepID=A0A955LV34_UNCKA|nr:thiamine pyrophosphate-binding protein [candidate division WWE3 bacterium]
MSSLSLSAVFDTFDEVNYLAYDSHMQENTQKLSVVDVLAESLKLAGAEAVFGIPSYVGFGIINALDKSGFTLELNTHEQNAAHMAEGYYYATGKLPILSVAIGPGVTNAVTGIANAFVESVPMIVLVARAADAYIGKNEYHANSGIGRTLDEKQLFQSCTKAQYYLDNPAQSPELIRQAIYTALSGRPGPVVISVPPALQKELVDWPSWLENNGTFALSQSIVSEKDLKSITVLFERSQKPLIILGSEVQHADRRQLERLLGNNCLYITSYGAKGKVPALGNYFGTVWYSNSQDIVELVKESDLVLAIGEHFTHFTVRPITDELRNKNVIQISTYPEEIGRAVTISMGVVGDVSDFISRFSPSKRSWLFSGISNKLNPEDSETLAVLQMLPEIMPDDTVFFGDVGNAGYASITDLVLTSNQEYYTTGKFGVCGYSIPAAIGYSYGNKKRPVASIIGDLSLAMNMQEISNVVKFGTTNTFFVFNNQTPANITEDQLEIAGKEIQSSIGNIDYQLFAQSVGIEYVHVNGSENMREICAGINFSSGSRIVEITIPQTDTPLI